MEIEVLSNKDKVRQRVNVFHDSSSNWINLIKELVGNSLDVFDNKKTHTISIDILSPTKIEYMDNGHGIPLEGVADNGMPSYEAIFEVDFAGNKYGNTDSTVGQNGIFLWTLAMTCEDIEIEVARPNGNVYKVAYHRGDRVYDMKKVGASDKTYTKIVFEPDNTVWTEPHFTFEEIDEICKAQASLGNVEIRLKSDDKESIYRYEDGIDEYFKKQTEDKKEISDVISFTRNTTQVIDKMDKEFDVSIDMVMSFTSDSLDDFKKDFLNTADLVNYGSLNKGILAGVRNSINRYLRSEDMYNKTERAISERDVDVSLNYVCDARSRYVEYVSQSKKSTDAKAIRVAVQNVVEEFFRIYSVENPKEIEKIAKQILVNKRSRERAEKTRVSVREKLDSGRGSGGLSVKIEGLKDCDMRKSELEERIFLIDEGLSANSTIIEAFDNRYMGCMGLRGKFINSLKSSVSNVLNNDPALGIIKALGCGIEIPAEERKNFKDIQTFDIDNLRYGKIGILCDFDGAGRGIALGLLTFFYKFMPTLLKQGRIYIVLSPRYEVRDKQEASYYAYDEDERDDLIDKLGDDFLDISIRKGIGEFDKEEFWDLVLKPEAREETFVRVVYDEDEDIEHWFDTLMGDNIEGRKEFIRENITNIELEEVD